MLPRGLGREMAAASARGNRRAGAVSEYKGTTTLAPGINAFLSPAINPRSKPAMGVVSDGSLGTGKVTSSGATFTIPASAGAQVGGNLFESFSQFNLIENQVADFQGPSTVADIIARITGGNASSINGSIESSVQGANLFLINPAGIMFGPRASLNLTGAFTVATADEVKIAGGGNFNASLGGNEMLTAGAVTGFGFGAPAPVSFSGSELIVPVGTGLNVVAGNVTLDGATLGAPSGRLSVFATGSVSLTHGSTLAISGAGGGVAVVRAGAITLDDSGIASVNTGSAAGGDITVNADNALSLLNGGDILSQANGSGAGGNVVVQAAVLAVEGYDGARFSAIEADAAAGAGNAGNVTVTAGPITIGDAGVIVSSTYSAGDGGKLAIAASSLSIDGAGTSTFFTGITSENEPGSTGSAGTLAIVVAGEITVEAGGEISAGTFSSGNGGNLAIQARSLDIDGSATPTLSTSISSGSLEAATGRPGNLDITITGWMTVSGGAGIDTDTVDAHKAGDLTVHAGALSILGDVNNSTFISSDTFGGGNAGNVTISAGSILIDGRSTATSTQISAQSNFSATGAGGTVTINAGYLLIQGDGSIATDTFDNQSAGDIVVHAGAITILGDPAYNTGITSDSIGGGKAGDITLFAGSILIDGQDYSPGTDISAETDETGMGGKITIKSGSLVMQGGAEIDTDTNDNENAGDLVINAGTISIYGNPANDTFISSDTYAGGNAGNVTVSANTILIDGNNRGTFTGISATSEIGATGNGGNVTIDAGALSIEGRGAISSTTYSPGNGGDVTVTAHALAISGAESGIFSQSLGSAPAGAAGGISIQCEDLTVNAAGAISANAAASSAGDITVNAQKDATIEDQGTISSSAGVGGGNITVTAGDLLYLLDGSVKAEAGALRQGSGNTNFGNGGNITLASEFIVLNDGLISANAAAGQGGNILLETRYYLNSGSSITATGATSGTITITSPELDLSGALVGLPSAPVDAGSGLQESCATALDGDFSSFLAVGQGDVEAAPDEAQGGSGNGGRELGKRPAHRKPGHGTASGL